MQKIMDDYKEGYIDSWIEKLKKREIDIQNDGEITRYQIASKIDRFMDKTTQEKWTYRRIMRSPKVK